MPLEKLDFDYLRQMVREHSAIVLDEGKEYLVEMRLMSLARAEGVADVGALIRAMRSKSFGQLHRDVIDAMTTNETSFFRDLHPFETLKKEILPRMIEARASQKSLNIWCAACSSGQEPYTIAMVLKDNFPQLANWRVKILATDISPSMVVRARQGVFSQLEINRGLPAPFLIKYFSKDGASWAIKEDVKRFIEFREMNLATNWPAMPTFDIIFIRNVLIYFDLEMKRSILGRMRKVFKPDGVLFLGGAETTLNIDDSFQRVQEGRSVYYVLR